MPSQNLFQQQNSRHSFFLFSRQSMDNEQNHSLRDHKNQMVAKQNNTNNNVINSPWHVKKKLTEQMKIVPQ